MTQLLQRVGMVKHPAEGRSQCWMVCVRQAGFRMGSGFSILPLTLIRLALTRGLARAAGF